MTKCLGLKITNKLQTSCPVRFTCERFLDATEEDEKVQPKSAITAAGCKEYQRISWERFKEVK